MSNQKPIPNKIILFLACILILLIASALACGSPTSNSITTEPLTITNSTLSDGTVYIDYFQKLKASGGSGAYTWSLSSGKLTEGISFNSSTGIISGNPKSAGSTKITVTVIDSRGATASREFSINIKSIDMPMVINTTKLEDGALGVAYSQMLQASGGTEPYQWSLSVGKLPDGLLLNPDTGVITGTPTKAGTFVVDPRVVDKNGRFSEYSIRMKIYDQVVVNAPELKDSEVGGIYYGQLTASGGTETYSWKVTAGSLPVGLTLNVDTGEIEGTPTAVGTSNFTVKASDRFTSGTRELSLKTYPAIVLNTTSLPVGRVGIPYSVTLSASEGKGAYSWAISTGNLPEGLGIDATTGIISGTPKVVGSVRITVVVSDELYSYAVGDLIISVDPAP